MQIEALTLSLFLNLILAAHKHGERCLILTVDIIMKEIDPLYLYLFWSLISQLTIVSWKLLIKDGVAVVIILSFVKDCYQTCLISLNTTFFLVVSYWRVEIIELQDTLL